MNPLRAALGEEKYAAHLRGEAVAVEPHEACRFMLLVDDAKGKRIKQLEKMLENLPEQLWANLGANLGANPENLSPAVVYVSGPYSAPDAEGLLENIKAALAFGQKVRALGFLPLVPHVAILPVGDTEAEYEQALAECFELLARSDALVLMPTWEQSPGARRERAFAERYGVPVFESLEQLQEVRDAIG